MTPNMEGGIETYSVLDFAAFHVMANHNRFHAIVCSKGKSERIASGYLDILALHLPQAEFALTNHNTTCNFKLELAEKSKNLPWFTKSTILSFLSLVNSYELLKSVKSIQNEIFQLEGTRKCHLSLYAEDHESNSSGAVEDGWNMIESGFMEKVKIETTSGDTTKNDLILAIERRLGALRQTLSSTLSQALGSVASIKLISNVAVFCQYFGVTEMRNSLLRYLELISGERFSSASVARLQINTFHNCEKITDEKTSQSTSPTCKLQLVNPSESAVSTESCHPLKRSGSQKRSTSSIRRMQTVRSRSRKSPAISIKPLNYFSTRGGKNKNLVQEDQKLNSHQNVLDDAVSSIENPNLRRWSASMYNYNNEISAHGASKYELERETDSILPATADATQILLKMMESQPSLVSEETHGEKRGNFYDQYKEKRDQKLRSEMASKKRAEKELQFRIMQEVLDQRREEMRSSKLGLPEKSNARRNSCPPDLPKKGSSKSTTSRKSTPKSSSKVAINGKEMKYRNSQISSRISRNVSTESESKIYSTKKSSVVVPVESKPFLKKGGQRSLPAPSVTEDKKMLIESRNANDDNRRNMSDHVVEDQPTENVQPVEDSGICQMSTKDEAANGQTEKQVIEWGSDEKPPALVFNRKSAKGWKRLFMFNRKRKVNATVHVQSTPAEMSASRGNLSSAVVSVKGPRSLFSLVTFRSTRSRERTLRLCGKH